MTVIVGLVEGNEAYMASDTRISAGTEIVNVATQDHKIFRIGKMIVGCTGTFRTIQLIREGLKLPTQMESQSDTNYLTLTFAKTVEELYKEYSVTKDDDKPGFLVGYNSKVYRIFSNWSISQPAYDAIGSGGSVARGGLAASYLLKAKLSPEKRLRLAVAVAAHCDSGCGGPFHMVKIP